MSFKIIAIKPLSGSEEHLKNLKPEIIYYLNQDYKIQLDKIEFKKSQPKNFFSKQSIEICAIVGKNGSGKSSLTNLLVKFINNIFYYLREDSKNEGLHVVNKINNMVVEVYYHVQNEDSDSIYRIILDNTSYRVEIFRPKTIDSSVYDKITDMEFSIENFGKIFFYTQVIDYSLYSFNSLQEGDWINNIFHKNDSYQTPVVLNPYRKRGNIDINVENILSVQRFLSNIVKEKSNKQITDSLKVHKIYLSLKAPKDLRKQIINDIQYDLRYIEKDSLFNDFNDFFKCNRILDPLIKRRIVNYLVYKLASVAIKYNEYNKFCILNDTDNGSIQNQKNKGLSESLSVSDISDFLSTRKKYEIILIDIQSFFKQIQEDHSHITFKIKQIINYLKYNHLNTLEDDSINFQKPFKDIEGIENLDTIEFLPPPIFKVKIELVDSFNNKVEFETLSSGEKQMIFSQNSLFYHLRNLESVSDKFDKQKIQYQNVNIILDEIELYFHPEYQRKYIKRLITGIENLSLIKIKNISLIFSTHSPFILSDIPSLNVLKLNNGNPNLDNEIDETFGANIYDLLKDNFFLDGFIGEFALNKSLDLLNFLTATDIFYENWDAHSSEQTINLIAEPILREKFRNLYNKKFKTDLDIKKEIENLQNILKERDNDSNRQ
ncbi:AAA family ATPase [Chryseobacterium salviniae]|uniref:AAA family ATPase n=1 Tax=Chryseobacterium salviniae TaxID=3101750 RepID=A0ABU6HX04_9FLAO|nr:AAA family ATPase [Chryseobacterium sp. T9W2-O]MEC3876487.1 AAA family ATPase [Chryseobacterium sp. T9W2-O]